MALAPKSHPRMEELSAEVRMMYVSRHIYLLGASLVNVVLGLYLQAHPPGWRRVLQQIGSVVILLSPLSLLIAYLAEPAFGLAGRSWRSYFGLIGLFARVMMHIVASGGLTSGLVSKKQISKVSSEDAAIQEQLADARKEAQNAMGEFRSWGNPYYENVWLEAVEKVRRLEREISRRKMMR